MNSSISYLKVELVTALKKPSSLFLYYIFPLFFVLIVSNVLLIQHPNAKQFLIYGMLMFPTLVVSLIVIPENICNFRNDEIYKNYILYGATRLQVMYISLIATFIHIIITNIIIYIILANYMNVDTPSNKLTFFITMICSIVYFIGLGGLIGTCVKSSKVSLMLGLTIFVSSMLIGGITGDLGGLDVRLSQFSFILPTAHFSNIFAYIVEGGNIINISRSMIALTTSTIIVYIFYMKNFVYDKRNVKDTNIVYIVIALLPFIAASLL